MNRLALFSGSLLAGLVGTTSLAFSQNVYQVSCSELWRERNQIFKDAGYCFKTPRAKVSAMRARSQMKPHNLGSCDYTLMSFMSFMSFQPTVNGGFTAERISGRLGCRARAMNARRRTGDPRGQTTPSS